MTLILVVMFFGTSFSFFALCFFEHLRIFHLPHERVACSSSLAIGNAFISHVFITLFHATSICLFCTCSLPIHRHVRNLSHCIYIVLSLSHFRNVHFTYSRSLHTTLDPSSTFCIITIIWEVYCIYQRGVILSASMHCQYILFVVARFET
ncbi:hypothetical protein C8R42DRAFT_330756 [Lentinula raphanica]|nr:hypothetical protein C8R42DRAFT_330756 [Lentinula raphanica]